MQPQTVISNRKNIPGSKRKPTAIPARRTYSTEYVRSLFDGIAHRYDFLNHLLSSGVDVIWRRRAVSLLRNHRPRTMLDVATGTGDLAIEGSRLQPERIVGVDISPAMLDLARSKVRRKHLEGTISFVDGRAENLPFAEGSFDAVTVAFGVRNFSDLERGLREMVRVLRPGGVLVILEFSRPQSRFMRSVYGFYSERVLPFVAGSFSNKSAYEYLPSTIQEFPDGERFGAILAQAGLQQIRSEQLTFGIVTIYHGIKSINSKKRR